MQHIKIRSGLYYKVHIYIISWEKTIIVPGRKQGRAGACAGTTEYIHQHNIKYIEHKPSTCVYMYCTIQAKIYAHTLTRTQYWQILCSAMKYTQVVIRAKTASHLQNDWQLLLTFVLLFLLDGFYCHILAFLPVNLAPGHNKNNSYSISNIFTNRLEQKRALNNHDLSVCDDIKDLQYF